MNQRKTQTTVKLMCLILLKSIIYCVCMSHTQPEPCWRRSLRAEKQEHDNDSSSQEQLTCCQISAVTRRQPTCTCDTQLCVRGSNNSLRSPEGAPASQRARGFGAHHTQRPTETTRRGSLTHQIWGGQQAVRRRDAVRPGPSRCKH